MAGHADGGDRLRPRRLVRPAAGSTALVPANAARRRRARVAGGAGDPCLRGRRPSDRRGARSVAHLLRARPRPHPARQRLPPPGRQDAGVRLPRRPPAHAAHPRPRGGPGGHCASPGRWASTSRSTEAIALGHDCGHGPGGHASEDALTPYVAGWLRPRGVGRRRHADAAQPVRRDARRHPQPLVVTTGAGHAGGRGRSAGPTASPTSATTSKTPSPPASSPRRCCRPSCATGAASAAASSSARSSRR